MKTHLATMFTAMLVLALTVFFAEAGDYYGGKSSVAGYGKPSAAGYGEKMSYKYKGPGKYMPPPEAEKFWKYITKKDPYLGWGFWPGYQGLYPGRTPHGAYLKLYANSIALKAAREGKDMPYGAILVKENYAEDKKTLMALTPMYKVKGYNPDAGDWYWTKYGPEGEVLAEGKPQGCINCHRAMMAKDWRFTQPK